MKNILKKIKNFFSPDVAKRLPELSKLDLKLNTIIRVGSPEVGRILTREENLTLNSIIVKLHDNGVKLDIAYHDIV